MALRLHFFLKRWETFLSHAGYAKSTHFISPQFRDILHFLIFGLIQLVIIYRDTYSSRFPLLLWLHSTEVCEHVFGVLQTLVPDFTMLDFYNTTKKLFIRLRALPTVGKDTTAGYAHTYSDCHGIDLTTLSAFPTDDQINTATRQAYEEAENLLFILGVSPDLCTELEVHTTPPTTPTVTQWKCVEELHDDEEEEFDEATKINYLYEYAEALEGSFLSLNHQRAANDLTYASILLHTHEELEK